MAIKPSLTLRLLTECCKPCAQLPAKRFSITAANWLMLTLALPAAARRPTWVRYGAWLHPHTCAGYEMNIVFPARTLRGPIRSLEPICCGLSKAMIAQMWEHELTR